MISVVMDPHDKMGELTPEVIIKGDSIIIAIMLTVLVKRLSEVNPAALKLHAQMLNDPDFIMEVKND